MGDSEYQDLEDFNMLSFSMPYTGIYKCALLHLPSYLDSIERETLAETISRKVWGIPIIAKGFEGPDNESVIVISDLASENRLGKMESSLYEAVLKLRYDLIQYEIDKIYSLEEDRYEG